MKFTINDVGHGFSAHLQHDNGNVMLWDCGHKTDPENRPSKFLPANGINVVNKFFVTNYDEDHISDLPRLCDAVAVRTFYRNKTITPEQLRALKLESGPISDAMKSLLDMMETYTAPVTHEPDFTGVEFETFWCVYPSDFDDTNNISLVTFLRTPNINAIIPGDLEKLAWEKLLENSNFKANLRRTGVFIASHHGRTNGYCKKVFDYCSPSVVIFSDGPKQYATQEEADTYAKHASGITFNGQTRYVLTTRNDGSIWWGS